MVKVELGESIQRLADSGAFACASSMKKSRRGRAGVAGLGGSFSGQTCTCQDAKVEKPMRECRVLMFLSASLRMTAYEMRLEQNRRPLHMSAAHFLEEKIRRLSAGNRTVNENLLYESYLIEEEDENEEGETAETDAEVEKKDSVGQEQKTRKLTAMLRGLRRSRQVDVEPETGSSRDSSGSSNQRLQTIIGSSFDDRSRHHSRLSALDVHYKNKSSATKQQKQSKTTLNEGRIDSMAADLATVSDSIIISYTGYDRLTVLRIQYPQIAEQYRGAGNTKNTAFYLVEAAAACLALFDHQGAITYLREVNRIFRDLKRHLNPFEGRVANIDNWKPEPYDEGLLESLIGQTLFGMEKQKKAVPHFRLALKLFGCEQATSPLQMQLASVLERSRYGSEDRLVKLDASEALRLSSQALCLYYIFDECVARDDIIGARYAAVQQLIKTERAFDMLGQIEAATCMLRLAHLTNDTAGIAEYEAKAKIKTLVVMGNVRNDQVLQLNYFPPRPRDR